MRKYLAILIALVVVFALTAMAQTSNQTTSGSSAGNTSSSQQQPGMTGQSDTSGQQKTSGTWSSTDQANTSKGKGEKTLEGCIIREETDFFLVPKHGNPELLGGNTDFGPHVGHRVKLHGAETPAARIARQHNNLPTSGAAGTAAGEATVPSAHTGESGSVAGSTSSSSAAGGTAAGTGAAHTAATKGFEVVRLDMVSESCPANWNKNLSNGNWTGTGTKDTGADKTNKNPSYVAPPSPY